jgi:hypothetical protein
MTYEHVTVSAHDHPRDPPMTPQGRRIRRLGAVLSLVAAIALLAYVGYVLLRYVSG